MIIRNYLITMNPKEISDSLIHAAPRSVSLVHHNFRNDDPGVILQSGTNRRRNVPCEFAYAVPSARRSQSPIGGKLRIIIKNTTFAIITYFHTISQLHLLSFGNFCIFVR